MNLVKKLCMQQGCRKGRHGMHKAVGSRKKLYLCMSVKRSSQRESELNT